MYHSTLFFSIKMSRIYWTKIVKQNRQCYEWPELISKMFFVYPFFKFFSAGKFNWDKVTHNFCMYKSHSCKATSRPHSHPFFKNLANSLNLSFEFFKFFKRQTSYSEIMYVIEIFSDLCIEVRFVVTQHYYFFMLPRFHEIFMKQWYVRLYYENWRNT